MEGQGGEPGFDLFECQKRIIIKRTKKRKEKTNGLKAEQASGGFGPAYPLR